MSDKEQKRSALSHLMQSAKQAKKKHPSSASPKKNQSSFFPCPAGCGHHVSPRDVNVHLDKLCSVLNDTEAAAASGDETDTYKSTGDKGLDADSCNQEQDRNIQSNNTGFVSESECITPPKSSQQPSPVNKQDTIDDTNEQNAFSFMMKQSVKVFNTSESVVKHKFHLHHDPAGRLTTTWVSDQLDSTIAMDDVLWSATVTMKKIKSISLNKQNEESAQKSEPRFDTRMLELTISSSIPFQVRHQADGIAIKRLNFVQKHSRLSVPHLKSILQKSIRRRAPLPAVRVALELADRSFGDLLRRLPIIILEDSFLHDDFDLLVWLMVAESKGYVPPLSIMLRVFQIIFEVASCPRRDELINELQPTDESIKLAFFSLTTPSTELIPSALSSNQSTNKWDTLIRAILLRAQYGGMTCDVNMLHSYAGLWLRRCHYPELLSKDIVSGLPKSKLLYDIGNAVHIRDVPRLLHEPSHQKCLELLTNEAIGPGGLVKLTEADICCAGIDFHCSLVVESLLSTDEVYLNLCERLSSRDRDVIAKTVKSCIWNYSSAVNRRLNLYEKKGEPDHNDMGLRTVWVDVLMDSFNNFTKQFVRQRLAC